MITHGIVVFARSARTGELGIVDQYRYLGLVLNEYLDYKVTAINVAKAAHRALGVLISKDKNHGGMPYKVFT